MDRIILGFISLLLSQMTLAEFHDPMRPPPYAMKKFWLEKNGNQKTSIPVAKKQQQAQPWVLSSILYSGQRKHAIINDKLVRQGDLIKGARLVRLRPDSVQLNAKGKIINLSLRDKLKTIKKSSHERKL